MSTLFFLLLFFNPKIIPQLVNLITIKFIVNRPFFSPRKAHYIRMFPGTNNTQFVTILNDTKGKCQLQQQQLLFDFAGGEWWKIRRAREGKCHHVRQKLRADCKLKSISSCNQINIKNESRKMNRNRVGRWYMKSSNVGAD